MKHFIGLWFCGLLLAFALGQTSNAQTPDELTPVNEGVCDDLKVDGVTQGLYGLCVAFCEAQDHADVLDPITQEEYDPLFDGAPSGKILASYDKMKQDGDPDMPCIKVEEPCPCWDSAEFNTVVNSSNSVDICFRYNTTLGLGSYILHYNDVNPWYTRRLVHATDRQRNEPSPPYVIGSRSSCKYEDFLQSPRIRRVIDTTPEEFVACDAQIRQAMLDTSRTCTDYN